MGIRGAMFARSGRLATKAYSFCLKGHEYILREAKFFWGKIVSKS